jgi:hypothetical protein
LNPLRHALKEWAVAIRAMERGLTALAVRKGGIREKAFAVERERFLLFPSYEHQNPEQLKPGFHGILEETRGGRDDGPVRFTSFAEVHRAYEISDEETLQALDPYHVWTREYAESRLKWRPKKPLTILVLRNYLLPEPVEIPYSESYGGCKSWIPLERGIPVEGARPAIGDAEFERLTAPALRVLETAKAAPVG